MATKPTYPVRFLDRLINIVDNCIKLRIGEWNETSFYVYDKKIFEKFIRPYSMATFKRQLNYYNFTITLIYKNTNKIIFSHPNFTRDNYDKITRVTHTEKTMPMPMPMPMLMPMSIDNYTELKVEINSVSRCSSPITLVNDEIFVNNNFELI